ncbi:MAG: DHA2 family efflux MFS transporter permease subunit [Alphaproteobacteria bacterium]|nr:DHA2 family efflux MFS transporter permease subunit [Alphaproteobacteria bacterium]
MDAPAPLPGASAEKMPAPHQVIGFFAMVFGMFMAILDIQIVSSSIGEIQAGLAASSDEISWIQTSYLIAEVVMIPLSGYLSRLLSTRILFVLSALGFTVSSLACAFAWNIESMIVFRAIQGFLGGAMIPTAFATAFALFPASKRTGVTILIGLVATMAPTLGPTLGGWLTQLVSWHWLFLINIVPGILVSIAVALLLDIDKPDWSLLKGFDGIGLVLMATFLGTLEYVVEEGPRKEWFADQHLLELAIVCAASSVLFFWRMFTYANPIVDLRAFADRNFAIGCLFSFMLGIGLYGAVYLMPLYLGQVRGLNSLQIGEIMFVTGAFQFLSAPIAGALSRLLDPRVMLAIGLSLFGTGVWMTGQMTAEWGFWEFFLPQAVRGLSLMLCFMPINSIALGTLPPEKVKNASGLYNLMRNLGGAVGLAVLNTILSDQKQLHWNRIAQQVNAGRDQVNVWLDSVAAKLSASVADPEVAAMKKLSNIVAREAAVMSMNDAFLAMAAVFAISLLFMPLLKKPKAGAGADAH